jgi:hypothetical protein
MRRSLATLGLLTGCGSWFGLDEPQLRPDARAEPGIDALVVDGNSLTACPAGQVMELLLCFDFDRSINDEMGNAGTFSDKVNYVPGKLGEAVRMDASSVIKVQETTLLDLTQLTIQAWIRPSQLPAPSTRMGVLDVEGQYGMFLHEGGRLACVNSVTTTDTIGVNQWSHVACVIGASTSVYVNGLLVNTSVGGVLGGDSMTGATIGGNNPTGDPFIGDIDLMRLYRTQRSPAQICEAAGGVCQ